MNEQSFTRIPVGLDNSASEVFRQIEWQAGIAIVSFGVKIGLRINRREHFARLFRHFPPFWKLSPDNRVEHLLSVLIETGKNNESYLYRDHEQVNYFTDTENVLSQVESALRLVIGEFAENRVFIHAGVVGWKKRALIFPGRSHRGKSTLIRELVKLGATYYSDEFAVLDEKGRVHPYPKMLSLRESWCPGWQVDYPIEAFGGKQGKKPLALDRIVLADYRPEQPIEFQELSQGNGIMELLKHTCTTQRNPQLTLKYLTTATSNAKIWQANRGEAAEFARFMLNSG